MVEEALTVEEGPPPIPVLVQVEEEIINKPGPIREWNAPEREVNNEKRSFNPNVPPKEAKPCTTFWCKYWWLLFCLPCLALSCLLPCLYFCCRKKKQE